MIACILAVVCCFCENQIFKKMFLIQIHHRGRGVQGRQSDERRNSSTLRFGRRLQRSLPSRPASRQRVQVSTESPHRERDRFQPEEQTVHGPAAECGVA